MCPFFVGVSAHSLSEGFFENAKLVTLTLLVFVKLFFSCVKYERRPNVDRQSSTPSLWSKRQNIFINTSTSKLLKARGA